VLGLRGALEQRFEAELRRAVPTRNPQAAIDVELRAIEAADDGPSLSQHLERDEQYLEFVAHRSAYQLKEADPHSWALPRLTGGPKAALVEIQADEYGGGRAERMHAALFARAMDALGLGFGADATAFYDEHVVADAVHESVAAVDLAGGLSRLEQPP
jgi:hypothetical protein